MDRGRTSIEIPTLGHVTPIPVAARIGPLIESSIITPYDPGTRDVPAALGAQVDNLFTHMGDILEAAGAGWADVAKVTFFTEDPGRTRQALNRRWLEVFPNPGSRPARHTMHSPAPGTAEVACVFTAYVTGP